MKNYYVDAIFGKVLRLFVAVTLATSGSGFSLAYADGAPVLTQPAVSSAALVVSLKGLKIDPADPFHFEFIIDTPDATASEAALKDAVSMQIRYFLACLAMPEKELWVNLSPVEADRIIPDALAQTELGEGMLTQDLVLKQISSGMTDPSTALGKAYWASMKGVAPKGDTSKIWIVPSAADIFADGDNAYVTGVTLKVKSETANPAIVPAVEREVNTGEAFAPLRQICNALMLATWFKLRLKESVMAKIFADRGKVKGVDLAQPDMKDSLYRQYLAAFKKGAYDVLKKERDSASNRMVKRRYFSGGLVFSAASSVVARDQRPVAGNQDTIGESIKNGRSVSVRMRPLGRNGVAASAASSIVAPPSVKGTVDEEEAAEQNLIGKAVLAPIDRDFGEIVSRYGYRDFVRLSDAVGPKSDLVFLIGLPAAKKALGNRFEILWPDLVTLGIAAGMNARVLLEHGLPPVCSLFGDELYRYWPGLVRLGVAAGPESRALFERVIPGLKDVYGDAFLLRWQDVRGKLEVIARLSNEYNRSNLINLMATEYIPLYKGKPSEFSGVLDLWVRVLKAHPRLGLQILDDVSVAVKTKAIGDDIGSLASEGILPFAARTAGFEPGLYRLWQEGKDEALAPVEAFASNVLADAVGEKDFSELEAYFASKGIAQGDALAGTVAAAVATAIPMSGASFVKKNDVVDILRAYRKIGDRRADIPERLRAAGFFSAGTIQSGRMSLRTGETFDATGLIGPMISLLQRPSDHEAEAGDRTALKKSIEHWFADFGSAQRRSDALNALLSFAANDGETAVKIASARGEYETLIVLADVFRDKGILSKAVRSVLADIPTESFPKVTDEKSVDAQYAARLVKQLNAVWSSGATADVRLTAVSTIVAGIGREVLREKVISRLKDDALKAAVLSEASAEHLGLVRIIGALFSDPLRTIDEELAKFERQKDADVRLSFRAVKGIPYGLWGWNAGICTARDYALWANKAFYLIAMIDETSGKAVGFIHCFESIQNGKRVLTIPGIDPSAEFLGSVKSSDVWPLIETAIKTAGRLGGYEAVYIPCQRDILSERKDIREAVAQAGYAEVTLDAPVYWDSTPRPHPFEEVYEVPMGEEKTASSAVERFALTADRDFLADGLPILKTVFGDNLRSVRPDLVLISQSAGANARGLFSAGLPAVSRLFKDDLMAHWHDLVIMAVAAGSDANGLFEMGLPAAKKEFGDDFFVLWPGIVKFCVEAGPRAANVLRLGLPAFKNRITDAESLYVVGTGILRLLSASPDLKESIFLARLFAAGDAVRAWDAGDAGAFAGGDAVLIAKRPAQTGPVTIAAVSGVRIDEVDGYVRRGNLYVPRPPIEKSEAKRGVLLLGDGLQGKAVAARRQALVLLGDPGKFMQLSAAEQERVLDDFSMLLSLEDEKPSVDALIALYVNPLAEPIRDRLEKMFDEAAVVAFSAEQFGSVLSAVDRYDLVRRSFAQRVVDGALIRVGLLAQDAFESLTRIVARQETPFNKNGVPGFSDAYTFGIETELQLVTAGVAGKRATDPALTAVLRADLGKYVNGLVRESKLRDGWIVKRDLANLEINTPKLRNSADGYAELQRGMILIRKYIGDWMKGHPQAVQLMTGTHVHVGHPALEKRSQLRQVAAALTFIGKSGEWFFNRMSDLDVSRVAFDAFALAGEGRTTKGETLFYVDKEKGTVAFNAFKPLSVLDEDYAGQAQNTLAVAMHVVRSSVETPARFNALAFPVECIGLDAKFDRRTQEKVRHFVDAFYGDDTAGKAFFLRLCMKGRGFPAEAKSSDRRFGSDDTRIVSEEYEKAGLGFLTHIFAREGGVVEGRLRESITPTLIDRYPDEAAVFFVTMTGAPLSREDARFCLDALERLSGEFPFLATLGEVSASGRLAMKGGIDLNTEKTQVNITGSSTPMTAVIGDLPMQADDVSGMTFDILRIDVLT